MTGNKLQPDMRRVTSSCGYVLAGVGVCEKHSSNTVAILTSL